MSLKQKQMKPIEALSKFFEARDVIHYVHFNTTSFAQHKALGEFYEGWLDKVDDFVETYQGRYGRITGSITLTFDEATDCVKYLTELRLWLRELRNTVIVPDFDTDLDNIIADMLGLVNHTLYMLTLN